jgi:hypothetical protein
MIGHRTYAARISGPTPPSRTRLRRALRSLRSLTATTARKQARHRFNAAVDVRPNPRPKPSTKTGQLHILIAAGAWLHANDLPDKQAVLENWIKDRLAGEKLEASDSTVREYARRILAAHRRALAEADN